MPKKQRRHSHQTEKSSKEPLKERILIVCEGKKTEPSYFKQLQDKLKIEKVNVDIEPAKNSAPTHIFNTAVRKQEQAQREGAGYEKIYCVFDKDHYAKFDEVSKNIEKRDGFVSARSSPCIEFWFSLHFKYTDKNFKDCQECLKDLKKQFPKYDKEITDTIFEKLWDKKDTAKKHAKQVKKSSSNTFTEVHLLLKELENLAE